MEQENEVAVVDPKFVFTPDVFDPNKDALEAIKEQVSEITADPTSITKEELITVSTARKDLMKARTRIKAIGKATRDDALKYQKDVIAYEKELIEIIEPEEKRLKEIEDDAKTHALREARREELPAMKEKLTSISGEMPKVTDEELLDMDPTQFQELFNDCKEEWLETLEQKKIAEAAEAEAKQKEIDDANAVRQAELDAKEKAIEDEKQKQAEIKEAEEKAKQEAEEKAQREKEAEEKARQDAAAKEKADKEAEEKAEAEAKAKRESAEKFQNWLAQFDVKEEDRLLVEKEGKTLLYKLVDEYHHN